MKITIRKNGAGVLSVYVPKKDLEQPIVSTQSPGLWGGVVALGNGWQLELPPMPAGTAFPVTVDARKLGE